MFIKLKGRAVPALLLVISSLWTAAIFGSLLYSLLFPNKDIRHLVWALEGRRNVPEDWSPLSQQITDSAGLLNEQFQLAPITMFLPNTTQKNRTGRRPLNFRTLPGLKSYRSRQFLSSRERKPTVRACAST